MNWDAQRLGRHLKLRDLNVLMTVVECGTMGRAAARLAVSQPAISKAIADMEHMLGVRLLDRGPQGAKPTIYASALLDHGVIAFDELQQAVRRIECLADPTGGHLRIGCSVVLAEGFVTTVINRFSQRYPRVTLELLAAESGLVYRAVEERNVDLAILLMFEPAAKGHLTTEVLYDEPHVIAASAKNPWSKRRGIRLTDLINEPWGLAAAREPDRLDRPGSVSRGTACGSQRSNHHVLHSRSLFSRNKRTISFHSTRLHVRICEQEASAKNLAGRVGNNPQADRNHSLEEPFTHSSSAAFHRLCSQRC